MSIIELIEKEKSAGFYDSSIFGGFAVSIRMAPRITAMPNATVKAFPGRWEAMKAPKKAPMAPAMPKDTPAFHRTAPFL